MYFYVALYGFPDFKIEWKKSRIQINTQTSYRSMLNGKIKGCTLVLLHIKNTYGYSTHIT